MAAISSEMKEEVIADPLMAPFKHVSSLKSKHVRSKFIDAFVAWIPVAPAVANSIKEITTMLHNASLLIDDIEDNSERRRGAPSAHMVYGMPLTLNCANTVYFIALQKVLQLPFLGHKPQELATLLTNAFVEQMLELHQGQGKELLWRDTFVCPTLDEYRVMSEEKTGGLIVLTIRLMMLMSDNSCDEVRLTALARKLGFFYQVLDDYFNVVSEQYHVSKTFFEDLTEGKFSYPIAHSIFAVEAKGDTRLFEILQKRTKCPEDKKAAIAILEETGSLSHTREIIVQLQSELLIDIDQLGGCRPLADCLGVLTRKV